MNETELANEVEAVARAGISLTDTARVHRVAVTHGLTNLAKKTTVQKRTPVEEKQYQEWAKIKAKQLAIAQAILHENK